MALPSIGEYGIVGGGQSLSIDTVHKRLIVAGIHKSKTNASDITHTVLTSDLDGTGPCGAPFVEIGGFKFAAFMPVAHASELDRRSGEYVQLRAATCAQPLARSSRARRSS